MGPFLLPPLRFEPMLAAARLLAVCLVLASSAAGCRNPAQPPTMAQQAGGTGAADAAQLAAESTATALSDAASPTAPVSPVALANPVTPGVAGVLRRPLPLQADAGPASLVAWGDGWMLSWCWQGTAQRALVSGTALHRLPVQATTSCTQRLAGGGGWVWWLGAVDGKPSLQRARVAAGTPLFSSVGLPEGLTVTDASQLRVDGEGRAWWALARSNGKADTTGILGTARPDAATSDSRDAEGIVAALAALGGQEAVTAVLTRAADGTTQGKLTRWKPSLQPVWQRPWEIGGLRRLGQPLALAATGQQLYGGRGAGAGLLLETDNDWQLAQLDTNGQVNIGTRVPRSRDAALLAGMPDGAWLVLQSRTGGMWLQRVAWRGTTVERAMRFGWLGDEQVLAAGHSAHVLGLLSRDGDTSVLLLTALEHARLSDVAPRAPPKQPADCRDAEPCDIEVEFGAGVCGSWPLSDGQACGSKLTCRQGLCRAP